MEERLCFKCLSCHALLDGHITIKEAADDVDDRLVISLLICVFCGGINVVEHATKVVREPSVKEIAIVLDTIKGKNKREREN